jgi:hypothetical protein
VLATATECVRGSTGVHVVPFLHSGTRRLLLKWRETLGKTLKTGLGVASWHTIVKIEHL